MRRAFATAQVRQHGEVGLVNAPLGEAIQIFVANNAGGGDGSRAELHGGETVYNPMRVIPNSAGSEFIFTLLQAASISGALLAAEKKLNRERSAHI